MQGSGTTTRDARGDWRPAEPIALPPTIAWPPRPRAIARWLLGFPGYLWPMNTLWLALLTATGTTVLGSASVETVLDAGC